MHSLAYRVRSLSEEKFCFVGGGAVRATREDVSRVLRTKSLSEDAYLARRKKLPDDLVEPLRPVGRLSGKAAGPHPVAESADVLTLKAAYAEARVLADPLADPTTRAFLAAVDRPLVDVTEAWLASPKLAAAYALLRESVSESLPSPDTFRDLLTDIAAERLQVGVEKLSRSRSRS